ncbi:MAG: YHS domain-containing (seleno)protein [Rhizobiaceae bacterium]
MNRRSILLAAAAIALMSPLSNAYAGKAEIYAGLVDGVAVGGYDAVSFFSGSPVEGKADFATKWSNVEWRFATAENRDAFLSNPQKYAPQYGGYCAYAVAKGSTAKGDPKAWSVVDGKLYLNFNASIRSTWQSDATGNISKANTNWPKVLE